MQGLKELKEGEEVDIEVPPAVPPPTWNIEAKDQQDSLQGVNGELGNPPDSSSPEGSLIPYLPPGDYPADPSPLCSMWEVVPLYLLLLLPPLLIL